MIKIYGRDNCVWCDKAKKVAEDYGYKYQYVDINDPGVTEYLKRQGLKTVPQIWQGDQHVGGYSEFAQMVEETSGGYGEGRL